MGRPRSTGHGSLELDLAWLRALSSPSARDLPALPDRVELLERIAQSWPERPSVVLRLAPVAHRLEEGLDERLAEAPARLSALAGRDPWTVDGEAARTVLLAALVRAEEIDYGSFVPAADMPMILRDALTDPADMATLAAVVRWETLTRLGVSTPDELLRSWLTHVASIARDARTWDPSEYVNTPDIRSHLQRFAGVLSWAGQAQWREHIEPADETFRACTERRAAPLALMAGGREVSPAEWWRYRHPIGFSAEDRDALTRDVEADRYVSGPTRLGNWASLRTISHVWDLAERRDGLRAMTDQELSYWARVCARQARAEDASGATGSWHKYDEAARHEQQRRHGHGGSARP